MTGPVEADSTPDAPGLPEGAPPGGDGEAPPAEAGRSEEDASGAPSRMVRWFVAGLLVLLLVPGLVGFDAWPLTGWRLFSVSRKPDRIHWVVQAVDAGGQVRTVDLEDLPLRYRHAEWPMAELPGASESRREAVCQALGEPIVDRYPDTVEVRIARDHEEMVQADGEWTVTHDPEELHACRT